MLVKSSLNVFQVYIINKFDHVSEFIEVGKPARALDTLYEVFKNKKWAYNWSESVLEPIMFKYLDLCVELKKSHIAKEGLFQYRNMFQSVSIFILGHKSIRFNKSVRKSYLYSYHLRNIAKIPFNNKDRKQC